MNSIPVYRCRYLVWAGPKDYKECDTLSEALLWAVDHGGEIFEPLGATEEERRRKERGDEVSMCARCTRPIRHGLTILDRQPYHEGCARIRKFGRVMNRKESEEDKKGRKEDAERTEREYREAEEEMERECPLSTFPIVTPPATV